MPDIFSADAKDTLSAKHSPLPVAQKDEQLHSKKPQLINSNISVFTSFAKSPDPEQVHFENQETDETIHLFLRRHYITNIPWILTIMVFIPLPFLGYFLFSFTNTLLFVVPVNYLFILLAFYYLVLFGYAFISFLTWFYNVGFVTNLRVVDIDVSHITHKNVASTAIEDIVDVEYTQSGFLSNILDYGNVGMQTEGMKPNFEFHAVPKPGQVSDMLSDLIREAR